MLFWAGATAGAGPGADAGVELTAGVALFAPVDLKVPGVEDGTKAVLMGCKAPAKPGGIPEDGTAAGPVDCCKRVADTEPTAGVALLAPVDLKVPGAEDGINGN